jgi:cytochrome c-type biogenesis protein CcsB
MPTPKQLETYTYRVVAFGFFFLTFTIICGAIWAEQAWGTYWAWDPKETWALITWIIYAVFLHLRFQKGMRGNRAAWFAVAGFLCVIFTYIGVNLLLPGLHSYA